MRLSRLLVSLSILLLAAPPNTPHQSSPPQQPAVTQTEQVRAETVLSKTVTMISIRIEDNHQILKGTGFFTTLDDDRLPADKTFGYLVTNKHVVQAIFKDASGQCKSHTVTGAALTPNLKTALNGNRIETVLLPPPSSWFFPEDPAIDLAVLPYAIQDKYDANAVGTATFLTPDTWQKLAIAPGDKLLTTGFFRFYAGTHQFQPMIREGSLAMVPDDAMPSTLCDAAAKVYLADVHIIPGNSGSPVYLAPRFTLGGFVQPSNGALPYGLLGVVSGYLYEDSELTLRTSTDYEAVLHANSGIAIIVPAEQLKALLLSPALQHFRDQVVETLKQKK